MRNEIDLQNTRVAFRSALRKGRSDTSLVSRLRGQDNRILLLSHVLDSVSVSGETYLGLRDVRVDRIIGTENRGDDFSRDFKPIVTWLGERWMVVYDLLNRSRLDEPIKAFEVGGFLFVRDGHHRVSAAKALEAMYLPAIVTRYELPYGLPRDLDRNTLPLLQAKARFHEHTGVFDILDEDEFFVACPETWDWLEREICEFNRAWFLRRFDREPEDLSEQVKTWYQNLYHNAIEYIRSNSLSYLFPGKRETDIFIEMIRLWNSHQNPDGIWLGEVYEEFLARQRRRHMLLTPVQLVSTLLRRALMSAEDEYRRFLAISQVEELIPEFCPLPKEKGFYRFLYRELVHRYAAELKPRYGRAPYIQELTPDWYYRFYAPVAQLARTQGNAADQVKFYMRFSRRHLDQVLAGRTDVTEALREYRRTDRRGTDRPAEGCDPE